tara:strand:+ start:232 stop:456 length:225 start_codon:yes stop_codon:yes gene_type:complete
MAKLLNDLEHENELLNKFFFYGDYLANETASGKEECGIRLRHDLTKEEVEELHDLVEKGYKMHKFLMKGRRSKK